MKASFVDQSSMGRRIVGPGLSSPEMVLAGWLGDSDARSTAK